jgi:PilZ domain
MMANEQGSERESRRFLRFDLSEDVRAVDTLGHDIGRVEKVGAGGLQIRLSDPSRATQFAQGSQFELKIVEGGNTEQRFKVEVRVCHGDLLGLQFMA